jgi:hypothetical protein
MSPENNSGNPKGDVPDRRTRSRFPLRLAITYRRIGSQSVPTWTSSETVNISSTGLLFSTPEAVWPGQGIEALITWPISLDRRVPLKLVVRGSIVRSSGELSAVCFERYEFKTSQAAPGTNPRPDGRSIGTGLAMNSGSSK